MSSVWRRQNEDNKDEDTSEAPKGGQTGWTVDGGWGIGEERGTGTEHEGRSGVFSVALRLLFGYFVRRGLGLVATNGLPGPLPACNVESAEFRG